MAYTSKTGREYISGVDRSDYPRGLKRKTHLFEGDFGDPARPLCKRAYDRWGGYSIFRNNVTELGYCEICKKRADKGLDGISWDGED
jgi:hypothetical protein